MLYLTTLIKTLHDHSCKFVHILISVAAGETTHHVQAGRTDLQYTTDVSAGVSEPPHHDTQQHAATRGHCDRHQLHYWKFLSDERLSANVPSALQRHLSRTLCQHLFWTVTLWHYLKLDLKLIFSLLFLANWLDRSASASEAIAPLRSTNRVLLLLF